MSCDWLLKPHRLDTETEGFSLQNMKSVDNIAGTSQRVLIYGLSIDLTMKELMDLSLLGSLAMPGSTL